MFYKVLIIGGISLLLVCKNHIKQGIEYLHTPHIIPIKDLNFKGTCVFCEKKAEYKLFYSVPVSKHHRIKVQQLITAAKKINW